MLKYIFHLAATQTEKYVYLRLHLNYEKIPKKCMFFRSSRKLTGVLNKCIELSDCYSCPSRARRHTASFHRLVRSFQVTILLILLPESTNS